MDLHLGKKEGCDSKKEEEEEEEEEEHQDQNPTQNHLFIFSSSSSSSSPSPSLSLSSSNLNLEHMFDKVVTPSDVGKLNRLVIPKQFAEKYFPLKPSATVKGMQLTFGDRAGELWEFRYSYWNSSQSYVMTRGWSRFVREKQLDTGDTVSFCRGRGCLFIDWHCQPRPSPLPRHHCPPPPLPLPSNVVASVLQSPTNPGGGSVLSFRSVVAPSIIRWGGEDVGCVVSMPIIMDLARRVVDRPPNAKRFRLFGVDMECVGAGEPAMTPKRR